MISQFRVRNYKALRDVTLDLTPVHVLIGPNDSGKTSIMEALAALCRSVELPVREAFLGSWEGADLVWQKNPDLDVWLEVGFDGDLGDFRYRICAKSGSPEVGFTEEVIVCGEPLRLLPHCHGYSNLAKPQPYLKSPTDFDPTAASMKTAEALRGVQYYRWDPRLLALPVAPDANRRYRMEPSGFGLASCLDDILSHDRSLFEALERAFIDIFPQIRSIRLKTEKAYVAAPDYRLGIAELEQADGKGIHFQLRDGKSDISAAQSSDGTLLVLAYLTILHLPEPPRVILIEQPENGLHPNRLKQILDVVRHLVENCRSQTQVLLTTHSPYLLNSFSAEEVTLCFRQDDGSVTTRRLSASRTVQEQSDIFSLGEIWTAEGDETIARH